ncbi:hypothetical protein SAMN05880501_104148 [Ureibacillus xyleni]|uniref:Uncharacterized protein n=1 Tax=Ureibacillus xyleni TaxID=614648 RepID=A0A285SDN9_9BACL|nr:hypothetical protein [Ureibacillus xyleni]SOC05971.1 hypothetical protein SAMN05880501_104148 [Ureibacillus xyleni]
MGEQQFSNKNINNDNKQNQIESEVILDRNSLIISQTFTVNAIVGAEQKLVIEEIVMEEVDDEEESTVSEHEVEIEIEIADTTIRQDYTLIYAAPATPMRSPILMTIIARNLSENDVLVSIEDEHDVIAEEVVPANSELALTAQHANLVRALALAESQVQFVISVFHPINSI